MPVDQVVCFRDNRGGIHDTEAAAKHTNGNLALSAHLTAKYGEDPIFNVFDILMHHMEWTSIYLEGSNS